MEVTNIRRWVNDLRNHVFEYGEFKGNREGFGAWCKRHNISYQTINSASVRDSNINYKLKETIDFIIREEQNEMKRKVK